MLYIKGYRQGDKVLISESISDKDIKRNNLEEVGIYISEDKLEEIIALFGNKEIILKKGIVSHSLTLDTTADCLIEVLEQATSERSKFIALFEEWYATPNMR